MMMTENYFYPVALMTSIWLPAIIFLIAYSHIISSFSTTDISLPNYLVYLFVITHLTTLSCFAYLKRQSLRRTIKVEDVILFILMALPQVVQLTSCPPVWITGLHWMSYSWAAFLIARRYVREYLKKTANQTVIQPHSETVKKNS